MSIEGPGGSPTLRRQAKLLNRINQYWDQSRFLEEEIGDTSDLDRSLEKLNEVPESFLSPNPDDPFREDLSYNWDLVKEQFNLRPIADLDQLASTVEGQQRDSAMRALRGLIEDYGIETVASVAANNPGPDEVEQTVGDILEVFPPEIIDAVIREEVGIVFDLLESDLSVVQRDREQAEIEQMVRRRVEEGSGESLRRLREAFGQNFEDINDAIERLSERMAQGGGPTLRTGTIEARLGPDNDLRVRISGCQECQEYRPQVRRRVRNELDVSNLTTTWTTVGNITVADGQLTPLDLEPGREALGAVAEPQPLPEETDIERLQETLPDPDTSAERQARTLIDQGVTVWVEQADPEDMSELVSAVERDDLPEGYADAMREAIEGVDVTVRQEANAENFRFGLLESALGLEQTDVPTELMDDTPDFVTEPDAPEPPDVEIEGPVGAEIDPATLPPDQREVYDEIARLIRNPPGTVANRQAFTDAIANALEREDATLAPNITQDQIDTLGFEARAGLIALASGPPELGEPTEEGMRDEFPKTWAATSRGGGRGVPYFTNVLAELRGEQDPERIDPDELATLEVHRPWREAFIARVEDHIDALESGGGGRGGGGRPSAEDILREAEEERGTRDRTPSTPGDTFRDEPGEGPVTDTSWMSGEEVTRYPAFEKRFVRLLRKLGYARKFDVDSASPWLYFQLTDEEQRIDYGETPVEWLAYLLRSGQVTQDQLRGMGFREQFIPDVNADE